MISWTVLAGWVLSVGASGPPATQSQPAERTRLDLRVNPLIDMHYYVRSLLAATDGTQIPADFAPAVAAARELDSALGGALGWGLLEGNLEVCQTADDAVKAFSQLPESYRMRDGRSLELRALTVRLAEAYRSAEPEFRERVWPQHREALEAARSKVAIGLLPHEPECLAYVLDRLGMPDPHCEIPVFLVAEAPWPGGFTHRRKTGGGLCFVGIKGADGSLLWETVLHEAIHALDIATPDGGNVLASLRQQLQDAGLGPATNAYRDVPHTLIFVQAGETVRRLLDPAHQHYGDVRGYYAKVPKAAAVVKPNWTAYLDGQLSRDAALKKIVAAAVEEYRK